MKKLVVTLLALAALLATSALAQVPDKPVNIYIGGGLSVPTGTFDDGWKVGFHGSGRVGYAVAPKVEIMGGIDYHSFPLDDKGTTGIEGGTFSAVLFGGDVKINLGVPAMSANPFLFGGLGIASISISDIEISGFPILEGDSETDLFIEAGAGVKFNRFFIQVKYVSVFTEGDDVTSIPFTVGVKF